MADEFEEAGGTMSPSDATARRLASLLVAFSNASTPLSSDYLRAEYYPDGKVNTFRKQFARDRAQLVLCGFTIREVEKGLWVADEVSFADPVGLDPAELAALDVTCLQLVEDPSFPYRNDLRLALAKIDSGYQTFPRAAGPKAGLQDRSVLGLLQAFNARHAVRATYTDAHGKTSEHVLAIWGTFGLRGHTYFVAPKLVDSGAGSDAGTPDTEASAASPNPSRAAHDESAATLGEFLLSDPRTWRDDRFASVVELPKLTYRIPPDFCAEDYKVLPFQIGKAHFLASFRVPKALTDEARSAMATYGAIEKNPRTGHELWTVEACDTTAAARWAIANGLVPVGPGSLMETWRGLLKEATSHAGQ